MWSGQYNRVLPPDQKCYLIFSQDDRNLPSCRPNGTFRNWHSPQLALSPTTHRLSESERIIFPTWLIEGNVKIIPL